MILDAIVISYKCIYFVFHFFQVGDIIRIGSNEGLPCDVVMLSSSEEGGECFVTTANLDGEANLKVEYN